MPSLSVAHVSQASRGGMGTVFRVLMPAQAASGDRISFFVGDATDDDMLFFKSRGVEILPLAGTLRLARELRTYDVVHVHSANLDLLVAAWLSRRATVFTLHGLRAQTRGARTLSTGGLPTLSGVRRRLKRFGLSFLLRNAVGRVTAVSEFMAGKASASYGVDPGKITVVYNGIALDQFAARSDPRADEAPVIGWVGRLVPVKRVDMVLRVAASIMAQGLCPGLRVIIVGDGPLMAELITLAESLGIRASVDFVGHTEKPESCLAQMDVFVFPSQNEGAGNVLNEAMAVGVPVVALEDGGGAVELVRHSGAGTVVADEAGLLHEVTSLLNDGERRRQLGERAIAYAGQELDPAAWAARYRSVYLGVLASTRRTVEG
jgi:glycosyltransferase involved in cell wall biosynthesis